MSLNPIRETLEDFFVERVSGARGVMRTLGWIAINGFRESVRDKVLYNLVAFAILLMGTSYLLGQLTAGQDLKIMKDLGLSADGDLRPVHGRVHRHRPRLEGSRAAQHLRPAGEADPALRGRARQVRRASSLTLTVNVAIMTAALYLVLAYVGWGENEFAKAGARGARARSGAAQGGRR